MIFASETVSSGAIAQTINMEKFPALYSTYMTAHPREQVKAVPGKNATRRTFHLRRTYLYM